MAGSYQYDPNRKGPNYQYTGPGGGNGPRKPGSWAEWIPIAILFCIPTGITQVIAVIMAVSKVVNMSRQQREQYWQEAKRTAYHVKDEFERAARDFSANAQSGGQKQGQANGEAQNGEYHYKYTHSGGEQGAGSAPAGKERPAGSGQTAPPKKPRKQKKKKQQQGDGSTGLIVGGGIMTGIFGLGFAATLTEFLDSLYYGFFFSDELVGALACLIFLCGGLAMLFAGVGGKRRAERYLNYLGYIGANREVPLAHMAATFGISVRKLCRDLRKMLAKGILPTGYLDLAEGKLYLTEMGYRAPEPKKTEPVQDKQEAEEREDAILREIRQVNDEIPDEAMSAKIDRIEEITGKILSYQKTHPNREGQLRSFLNYYLPTTLKILRAYAQLEAQGIEGENISAAKARIEGMMDQVVAGFEKQLDKLFQDDAMDINSDVQVLENMLKKDGLSGGDGMTMSM